MSTDQSGRVSSPLPLHKWGPRKRTDHHAMFECIACGTYDGSPRSDRPCDRRKVAKP